MTLMKPSLGPMKMLGRALILSGLGAVLGGCGEWGSSSDDALREGAGLPPGYALRLDRPNRDPADFLVEPAADGLRISTGPAGILFRPDQVVESGDYSVVARFTEVGAPMGHREGVGLFVGGQDLDGEGQRYLYLLVRADGRYVVKKRDGSSAEELSGGWKISEAVRVAAMEDGDVTNELSISVEGDIVSFWCNGERVEEMPVGDLSVHGVVGFRVNHNLSVNIQGFRVER